MNRAFSPGFREAELTAALPARFLTECARQGLPFRGAEPLGSCTLRLFLRSRDWQRAEAIAERCGGTLRLIRRGRGERALGLLRGELFLGFGLLGVLLLLFFSSLFIWDIRVAENPGPLEDREILAVLEELGVGPGCWWPGLSSELLCAEALLELPELSYLTVNIHGSRAEVLVRPRLPVPELPDEKEPTDLVAARGGVITELRALAGEAAAGPGDTVLPGELLIEGLSGGEPLRARGEVWARSWYELSACAPLRRQLREPAGREKQRWAVIFGKRQVNFAFRSGIPEGSCDRITHTYGLSLPGVFTLPLALRRESLQPVTLREERAEPGALEAQLRHRLREELRRRLGERGSMVTEHWSCSESGDFLFVTLRSECRERIDRERPRTE